MDPAKNNASDQDAQKIIVQRRGMLPDSNKPLDSHEPEVISPELKTKEEGHLESHKVRLEPSEEGAINATDNSKPPETPSPTLNSKAEAASSTPAPQAQTVATDPKKSPPKLEAGQPTPEEKAQKERTASLVSDKKYFVPITHKNQNRSTRQFVTTFLIVLIVGLVILGLAIDAGIIKSSIKPPIDLIKN